MSRLIVLKFGGTSLATPARVRRAARRVRAHVRAGSRVVTVVSATGDTTDRILRRLHAVAPAVAGHGSRESDRALATGELLSAALFAAALDAHGVEAASLSGAEAGLSAEGAFGKASLAALDARRIRGLLAHGVVPVVAGFQAARADAETVTIGRSGSDATAVFLAGMLEAEACHIITDVDAVCDSDPRENPGARRLPQLTHAALVQITESGAEVVQCAAARLAETFGTRLYVYHFNAPFRARRGTAIGAFASSRRAS